MILPRTQSGLAAEEGADSTSRFNLSNSKIFLLLTLSLAVFYAPFLRGGHKSYFQILDNLNLMVPSHHIAAMAWLHPEDVRPTLLGGRLPLSFLPSLTWPLTAVYLIGDLLAACLLEDLIVRLVALYGMYLLARKVGISPGCAALAGAMFAFSLTFTAAALTLAAAPLAIVLAQKDADGELSWFSGLTMVLLAWNSSLALGGAFLLILIEPVRFLLFGAPGRWATRSLAAYAVGLLLGNAGLIYVELSGVPLQRDDFGLRYAMTGEPFVHSLLYRLKHPRSHEQLSSPLHLVYLAGFIASFVYRNKSLRYLCLFPVLFYLLGPLTQFTAVARLRDHAGGLIKTFDVSRFSFLDPFLMVIVWVTAVLISSGWILRALQATAVIQLLVIAFYAPHISTPLRLALNVKPDSVVVSHFGTSRTAVSFADYFMQEDYREMKGIVAGARTLSVGLDPMVALANDLGAIDGYFTAYPLSYKPQFRRVIANQISAHMDPVFDAWGNKLYAEAPRGNQPEPDYCAAYGLGARFVVSRRELSDTSLIGVLITQTRGLHVYRIGLCAPTGSRK